MRLIDADAKIADIRKRYCEDCARRKNSKWKFCYEIGGVPCRACNLDYVIAELEDALTIHPEPHWIPCSEGLPKAKQKVLVQYADVWRLKDAMMLDIYSGFMQMP